MDTAVTATTTFATDPRCGALWLARLGSEERTALLGALLSRFNHDLRTPLNTILGWTHLLQKGGLDAARAQHVADVISRNTRDQTHLLEDFVDDGRAVMGVLQLQAEPCRIDDSVTQAIERISALLTLHGVILQSKLNAAEVSVKGDARRLTRLAYRMLAVVTRRARESSTVELDTDVDQGAYALSVSSSAYEPDWSEAAMLELRISTLMAALHGGELQVGADSTRPCIQLRLPRL